MVGEFEGKWERILSHCILIHWINFFQWFKETKSATMIISLKILFSF